MKKKEVEKNSYSFTEVFNEERKYISQRRKNVTLDQDNNKVSEPDNLFGLALSGGGIRSATLNMGFLNYLNDKGLLKYADYISSVSGGGFISGYIQTKLKVEGKFEKLFQGNYNSQSATENNNPVRGDSKELRDRCDYLIPGGNWFIKLASYVRVYGTIVSSFLMNLFWLAAFILVLLFLFKAISYAILSVIPGNHGAYLHYILTFFAALIIYHYFFFVLRSKRFLWSSNVLNYIEGSTIIIFLILFLASIILGFQIPSWLKYIINLKFIFPNLGSSETLTFLLGFIVSIGLFVLFGFFGNPNILSLHRYYRDRIANSFIYPFLKKKRNKYFLLEDVLDNPEFVNPYPLINTCLNITEGKRRNLNPEIEDKSKGTEQKKAAINTNIYGIESSDYFLLSPKFCGSSLTGYLPTHKEYDTITLPTATAVSASAVNTLMGNKTSKFIAVLIYLFNAKLGYWIKNPGWRLIKFWPWGKLKKDTIIRYTTFWPYYLGRAMLGKANHSRGRVNISDGGHIENLGVFELLRRRCKLIIAIDASCDPDYNFTDLRNLVVRAREKLGLKIEFCKKPEDEIRPKPSSAYSDQHYVKAKVTCLPRKIKDPKKKPDPLLDYDPNYEGTLIYVKSSLKAPNVWEDDGGSKSQDEANAFNYKINHPAFPHETTIDQFFDVDQWNAYYFLGRFIAEDILNTVEGNKIHDLDSLINYCETI